MKEFGKFIFKYPSPWMLGLIASLGRAYNGEWLIFGTIHICILILYFLIFKYLTNYHGKRNQKNNR
jgi:hypothetical protein